MSRRINGHNNDYFFLSDLVGPKCPPAVRAYVMKEARLDKIPVFTNPRSPHIQAFSDAGQAHFIQRQYVTYIRSTFTRDLTEKLEPNLRQANCLAVPQQDDNNPDKKELDENQVGITRVSLPSRITNFWGVESAGLQTPPP